MLKKCIKSKFTFAQKDDCREKKCKLKIDDLKDPIIFDDDKIHKNNSSCDCIIFVVAREKIVIGVIEIKSKSCSVSSIERKINNGIESVLQIINGCTIKKKIAFYPVLIHKGVSRFPLKGIENLKIMFMGRKKIIRIKKCGVYFSSIIN